jgi:hypothetical protein
MEPTITCPNCKTEIRLTESLAAPLIAATRKQFEQQLSLKDEEIAKREQGIRDKEKQVAEAKRNLDTQVADQVATQLKAERSRVIEEESKKAKQAAANELDNKAAGTGRASGGAQGPRCKARRGPTGASRTHQEAARTRRCQTRTGTDC